MNAKTFWLWTGCFSLLWVTALCLAKPICPEVGLHMVVGGMAIAASVYDWHTIEHPDVFTFGAALTGLVGCGLCADWDALAGAGYGFVGMKAVQIFCRRRHGKECIGSGDVILMLPLGAMTGIGLLPAALILALVCVAAYMRLLSRPKAPLGPFLTFGALTVVIISGGME